MKRTTNDAVPNEALLKHQIAQLGKLSWLWMNSPLHRDWDFDAAARFLLPPILLGQIQIIERDAMPVAYCSWAWLSEEAEIRYMIHPSEIRVEDWNGGDRLWFADWVAPFGAADSWQLRGVMAARFPNEVARAIRVKRGSKQARVMEFKGPQLPAAIGRERLKRYYEGFMRAASSFVPSDGGAGSRDIPTVEVGTPGAGNPGVALERRYVG